MYIVDFIHDTWPIEGNVAHTEEVLVSNVNIFKALKLK